VVVGEKLENVSLVFFDGGFHHHVVEGAQKLQAHGIFLIIVEKIREDVDQG
jgi:hypothetical protein